MSGCRKLVCLLLFLGILPAGRAGADTIALNGVAIGDREGISLDVNGARGLTIRAGVGQFDAPYPLPGRCHALPACEGGVPFSLKLGVGLYGTGSFEGRTFEINPSTEFGGAVQAFFDGEVILPPLLGQSSATVSAPFTFHGRLWMFAPGSPRIVQLAGRGTALATFGPNTEIPGSWQFQNVRYEFDGTAPVPEPATLLLAGGGLIAIAAGIRRKGRSGGGGSV
jgi:hypothetical protein